MALAGPKMSLLEFTLERPAVHWWCSVPGEPRAKERPRHRKFQKRFFTPPETRQAERDLAWNFKAMHPTCRLDGTSQFGIRAVYYCSRKMKDGDNLQKLLRDALEGTVYVNDLQVREDYARVEIVTKEQARTEFVVYVLEGR